MAKKKKGASGKRTAKRVNPNEESPPKQSAIKESTETEKPRMPERIREKDAGFGLIKIVVGVLIVLILGSGLLIKLVGGGEADRGNKTQGELCKTTKECARGSVCYSYKGERKRCMVTCPKGKMCDPGFTCVSAAERSGRKSTRVRAVCVEDAKR